MRSLRIVLSPTSELKLNSWHLLLLCAAFAATCLMWLYVGLLHESVARASRWQSDQSTLQSRRTEKAVVRNRLTLAQSAPAVPTGDPAR